jgi:hypothetical protein
MKIPEGATVKLFKAGARQAHAAASGRGAEGGIPPAGADSKILEGAVHLLRQTFHGQITIISQNHRIVQVERRENFSPEELRVPPQGLADDLSDPSRIIKKISQALSGLEFGQVALVVKKGHLVQIERLQKERLPDVQGLAGDGI